MLRRGLRGRPGRHLGGYPLSQWGLLLLVTATAQLMGHSVFNHLLATTSPIVVSLALLLEVPGAALLAAALILGQVPPLGAVVGLLVILAGMALVVVNNRAPGVEQAARRLRQMPRVGRAPGGTDGTTSEYRPRGDHVPAETRELRARRSCHAVPGSNPRFLEKAQGLDSDQVFLDLEDSVAPIAKPDARKNIVEVLNTGDWGNRVRTVRVNDWTTQWTYKDVIEVVEGAGANLDCLMLPKVQTADAGEGARRAAHPDRDDDGLRGRPDRHRGADRERPRPDQRRRHRHRVARASRRSSSARPTSWPRST